MRKRIRYAFLSLLIAFVLAELADRVYLRMIAPEDVLLTYGSVEQIRSRGIRDRYTPHPFLGYVPTASWSRGKDRHNAAGFRGAEMEPVKPAGVFRIACLGGSTTYGNEVEDPADAYPAALERELRARGHGVEVVNAAHCCWPTSSREGLEINLTGSKSGRGEEGDSWPRPALSRSAQPCATKETGTVGPRKREPSRRSGRLVPIRSMGIFP